MEILIAEDDVEQQAMYTACFREIDANIQLIFAQNGYDLLSLMANCDSSGQRPHLVLLDLNMPHMDGRSVLAKMKENQWFDKFSVAVLSASDYPIDRYLTKMFKAPFYKKGQDKEECLAVIKTILKRYDLQSSPPK